MNARISSIMGNTDGLPVSRICSATPSLLMIQTSILCDTTHDSNEADFKPQSFRSHKHTSHRHAHAHNAPWQRKWTGHCQTTALQAEPCTETRPETPPPTQLAPIWRSPADPSPHPSQTRPQCRPLPPFCSHASSSLALPCLCVYPHFKSSSATLTSHHTILGDAKVSSRQHARSPRRSPHASSRGCLVLGVCHQLSSWY